VRTLAIVLVVIALAGCSFVRPVRIQRDGEQVECKGTIAVPIIDSLASVATITAGVLWYASVPDKGFLVGIDRGAAVAVIGVGAVYAASAIYGFYAARDCYAERRRARDNATNAQ
jgi:hypothetical protein